MIIKTLFKYRYRNEIKMVGAKLNTFYVDDYGFINRDMTYYSINMAVVLVMRNLIKREKAFDHADTFYKKTVEHVKDLIVSKSVEVDLHPQYISWESKEAKKIGQKVWQWIEN